MKTKYFKIQIINDVLIAHFECAETSNAFGMEEAEEFLRMSKYAIKNNATGIIVTSDLRIFCSGGHLKNYARLKKADGLKVNKKITKILNEFHHLSIPTVCLLTGDCFGGGIEWISAFDKIFAAPDILLGMWQRKIALSWGWGGANRLKYRLPKKILANLLMDAKTFSAYEALNLNLIDAIYPRELLPMKAFEYFQSQAKLSNYPTAALKSLNLSKLSPEKEAKLFESLWFNPDHQKVLSTKR